MSMASFAINMLEFVADRFPLCRQLYTLCVEHMSDNVDQVRDHTDSDDNDEAMLHSDVRMIEVWR